MKSITLDTATFRLEKRVDMTNARLKKFLADLLNEMPTDWLTLTTHRLDIYHEERAKGEFLDELDKLYDANDASNHALASLPTAYDYIRLGHPLSSVMEWALAKECHIHSGQVISFQSSIVPLLAILRTNLFENKKTMIVHDGSLSKQFDQKTLSLVYGFNCDLKEVKTSLEIPAYDGSVVFVTTDENIKKPIENASIDFILQSFDEKGSILTINDESAHYVDHIQHMRRRETVAMTPQNCADVLSQILHPSSSHGTKISDGTEAKKKVLHAIKEITQSNSKAIVGSSGLSIQYAIMMGLIDHALHAHRNKEIVIVVPPNCYGGTNDQARRVAATRQDVSIMDLPVDGENDMVRSTDQVLEQTAKLDAVPLIIAEIPTNPRVEVPDLSALSEVLSKPRQTPSGKEAIPPVFILDQTFCPNYNFLGEGQVLSGVQVLAYVSGSKFPSGGKCTAGYCVANSKAEHLMDTLEKHLLLCENQATRLQMDTLAEQLPSMLQRINKAYENTRAFVSHIERVLPEAGINFVSEELAAEGFTPSVFSLDLPTEGDTHAEREDYKRALNLKLINMMISEIPNESKYCVSYGQLKGCYWTIPATSTQGTTKEEDKDYIARVAVAPDLNLEKHKQVFSVFVSQIQP